MEDQPVSNPLDTPSSNFVPASNPSTRKGLLVPILVTFLITAVTFGSGGYFWGTLTKTANFSSTIGAENAASNNEVSPSPESSVPSLSPTALVPSCEDVTGLVGYQICHDSNKTMSDYITGPSATMIEHVSRYSVSPNKEWLFVVRYSDEFAKVGGAPDEHALTMVDVKNDTVTELFSQIYFPKFTEDSWSSIGNGIVFTAGDAATPNILGNPNMFAVVYCTDTCRVLAKDAGPDGIGGDPAYFVGEKVHYTGMNDEVIEINFRSDRVAL
ncbi:hypothetical protein KA012_00750 [Candidatus Woesebacteria bacterium]|nr:hypothetical protein [Candidatus Woesebacteria bacterium]